MLRSSSSSSSRDPLSLSKRQKQFSQRVRPKRMPALPAGRVYCRMGVGPKPDSMLYPPDPGHPRTSIQVPQCLSDLTESPCSLWPTRPPRSRRRLNDVEWVAAVYEGGSKALVRVGRVLQPKAVTAGWGGQHHHQKLCPFRNCLGSRPAGDHHEWDHGGGKAVCMPFSAAKVAGTRYMYVHKDGYLSLYMGRRRERGARGGRLVGVNVYAHTLVCWLFHGPPPAHPHRTYEATHLCGCPSCLNPKHLQWATHARNGAHLSFHLRHGRGVVYVEGL